jgi:signal transduction histidine kinase
VVSLTEMLEVNWIILYFVYGQVFFVTGLVTGLQWRRRSHLELARPLPWLAAFGIAHGLNEWGYIFIPLQALYLDDAVVRLMIVAHLLLLASSYFFLFQFGVELVLLRVPRYRWLRAVPGVVLILWAVIVLLRAAVAQEPLSVWFAAGDAWSRYLLCLPGATLAGVGLERTIRVPAAVFRSVCGLAMAFFIVRSLEIFQVEDDRRIAEMEQEQILAADRERIGRELHDGIIQNIYAAGLSLEETHYLVAENPPRAQRQLRAVMDSLNRTIEDIRRYIFDLREAEQSRELETVLARLVQDLRLDTFLEVDLEVTGDRCCWLDHEQVAHVTQIAREALSNVVQHADASRVTVGLYYQGESTRLTVTDDGQGMHLSSATDGDGGGQGIANMQARARMLGGKVELASGAAPGLRLALTIPCSDCGRVEPEPERGETWT